MDAKIWGNAGGEIIKQRYHDRYNADPNYCKFCGKKIEIADGSTPAATKKKKFCDHSCAASYNNLASPKRKPEVTHSSCLECGKLVEVKRHPSGGFSRRKYCNKCRQEVRYRKGAKFSTDYLSSSFSQLTKGEIRSRTQDAHRTRTAITRHSRLVYRRSGRPYVCLACGYTLHVHVCHIKDIQEFGPNAFIYEINDPDNLITLCPTHHWEFDHGYWKMPK
jgi:Fe2+ or Zn2+ uptake regulation protein